MYFISQSSPREEKKKGHVHYGWVSWPSRSHWNIPITELLPEKKCQETILRIFKQLYLSPSFRFICSCLWKKHLLVVGLGLSLKADTSLHLQWTFKATLSASHLTSGHVFHRRLGQVATSTNHALSFIPAQEYEVFTLLGYHASLSSHVGGFWAVCLNNNCWNATMSHSTCLSKPTVKPFYQPPLFLTAK